MIAVTLDWRRDIGSFNNADEFTAWRFEKQGGVECQVFFSLDEMIDAIADRDQASIRAMAMAARHEIEVILGGRPCR